MAHMEGMGRHHETRTPMPDQLLNDDSRCLVPMTPTLGKKEDNSPRAKKSVITKVKQKAKKWRQTLAKKKHSHDDNAAPTLGVSMDDNDKEEVPEYLGAPMYESEKTLEVYKETAMQHPRVKPVTSDMHVPVTNVIPGEKQEQLNHTSTIMEHVLATSVIPHEEQDQLNHNNTIMETVTEMLAPVHATPSTIMESVTEMLAPAHATLPEKVTPICATVSEATQQTDAKIQGPAVAATSMKEQISSGEHKWDKGVSVKEYLIQKLEPGEEERALSQVISKAMSPRRAPGDVGMVEKVREAVSSLIWTDKVSSSRSSTTETITDLPISTNAYAVTEENNEERRLQANLSGPNPGYQCSTLPCFFKFDWELT